MMASPPRIEVPSPLQIRLPDKDGLREQLEQFCNRTRLNPPEAARQLMWMSLADGIEAAADRLGRDPKAKGSTVPSKARLLELLREATEIVSARKASGKRKSKGGK